MLAVVWTEARMVPNERFQPKRYYWVQVPKPFGPSRPLAGVSSRPRVTDAGVVCVNQHGRTPVGGDGGES
jgi:hypothetical protein